MFSSLQNFSAMKFCELDGGLGHSFSVFRQEELQDRMYRRAVI